LKANDGTLACGIVNYLLTFGSTTFCGDPATANTVNHQTATNEPLTQIVRGVLSAGNPLKIGLSGSRARGKARPGSDLGLLIFERSE
jgi:hypothetical protein